jgi:dTDP-glucose pyrophosphorylase
MSVTTKAVILARGLGTRMRREDSAASVSEAQQAVAASGVKGMIPIGRPFLDHVMTALADAGITQVCLVIGPEHSAVREYYTALETTRITVSFAVQHEPRGTADAVAAAEEFVRQDTFIVLNSDNFYPASAVYALAAHAASGVVGFSLDGLVTRSNITEARVRLFALVEYDERGVLRSLVEKPSPDRYEALIGTARVSMNLWSFTPVIFRACERVRPSVRGELELIDAVRIAMEEYGEVFHVVPSDEGVLDLSSRGDIAAVTDALSAHEVRL